MLHLFKSRRRCLLLISISSPVLLYCLIRYARRRPKPDKILNGITCRGLVSRLIATLCERLRIHKGQANSETEGQLKKLEISIEREDDNKEHVCEDTVADVEVPGNEGNAENKFTWHWQEDGTEVDAGINSINFQEVQPKDEKDQHSEQDDVVVERNTDITNQPRILNIEHLFENSNITGFDPSHASLQDICHIHELARTFEDKAKSYAGTNYSVEYFEIDENLMRLLELLDKIKCHKNQEMLDKKVEVIEYIRSLHEHLDGNVSDK